MHPRQAQLLTHANRVALGIKGEPNHDSTHAIWVNPLEFDAEQHGPPYLPEDRTASSKTAATMVAKADLGVLLGALRAAAHIHQTHHWQTNGAHFYGDHLLFMRLYEDSQPFIDQVAERVVGVGQPMAVDAVSQADLIGRLVKLWCGPVPAKTASDMVAVSLTVEQQLVQAIKSVKASLESKGELSEGTDNLLQGVSDKHEEFMYLLQQRGGGRMASYDRR